MSIDGMQYTRLASHQPGAPPDLLLRGWQARSGERAFGQKALRHKGRENAAPAIVPPHSGPGREEALIHMTSGIFTLQNFYVAGSAGKAAVGDSVDPPSGTVKLASFTNNAATTQTRDKTESPP